MPHPRPLAIDGAQNIRVRNYARIFLFKASVGAGENGGAAFRRVPGDAPQRRLQGRMRCVICQREMIAERLQNERKISSEHKFAQGLAAARGC